MNKIKILPEIIANKIAAGEVIERPASVVKELIENSIDAGATVITVEVVEAGKKLIRVTDNGCGMSPKDAELAFFRHATSKISTLEDLNAISTLGFRGEALPSIAAVSKVELITRLPNSVSGTRVRVVGGNITEVSETGAPAGTRISVNNLFYNTPARLKFLKSDNTELAHILAVLNRFALCYPEISFRLYVEGKETINLSPTRDIRERAGFVFGAEADEELLYFQELSLPYAQYEGLISKPTFTRSSWQDFYVYVNRRYVVNRLVTTAIYEGYSTLLSVKRYPIGAFFIKIDPKEIDVNVHPTKREIRFRNEKAIYEEIKSVIEKTLSSVSLIPELKHREAEKKIISPPEQITAIKKMDSKKESEPTSISTVSSTITSQEAPSIEKHFTPDHIPLSSEETKDAFLPEARFPELIPLAQLDDTYILCRAGEDLMIIDQHAAHERILYEQLMPKVKQSLPVAQVLLLPVTVELNPKEAIILKEHLAELEKCGLEVDHLGGNTYIIRAVPEIAIHTDYRALLLDIIDSFASSTTEKLPTQTMKEEQTIMAICRAAVKAGDKQHMLEWKTLVSELQKTHSPYTCPHGRPTVVRVSKEELKRRFKRQ